MLKKKMEDLKEMVTKKTEGNNKRKIENLVVFLVLLIVTVIAMNVIWGSNDEEELREDSKHIRLVEDTDRSVSKNTSGNSNISLHDTYNLESNLRDILSRIAGAGQVEVLITYSETSQIIPLYNETRSISTTEEEDSGGGTRSIRTNGHKKGSRNGAKKRSKRSCHSEVLCYQELKEQ